MIITNPKLMFRAMTYISKKRRISTKRSSGCGFDGWNHRSSAPVRTCGGVLATVMPPPGPGRTNSQEPVAEVRHTAIGCVDWISFPRDIPSGTKLYTAPPAAEQPDTVAVLRAVLADIAQDAEDSGALLLANRLRNLLAGCAE